MFVWILRQIIVWMLALLMLINVILLLRSEAPCDCLVYVAFMRDDRSMSDVVLYDFKTGLSYPLFRYANIRDITVSPDGQSLYFIQNRPNRLLRYDIYSGKITRLINGFIEYPIVAPNGDYLAFVLDGGNNDITLETGIYMMRLDTGTYRHVADFSSTAIAWYPDSQHITANLWNDITDSYELWSIDIATGERSLMPIQIEGIGWHQWHPDSNLLAIYSENWVSLYDLQTETRTLLTDNSRRPIWSVDGSRLAYIEQRDPLGTATINIATSQGIITQQISYQGNGFITRANWWQAR